MKLIGALFFAGAVALLVSSCSYTIPLCATSNPVGAKVGMASMTSTFFGWDGDAGIAAAAKNGGIKLISTVDIKREGNTYTTIVTGE